MSKDVSHLRVAMMGMIGGVVLIMIATILSPYIYSTDTFSATITEIEYRSRGGIFGGSDVTLGFDDGRVYNLYEARVPSGLRVGQAYTLEYRTPYLLSSPYIVIAETRNK